jgi:RNA polymerase sigma factor (sigma-70 family)
MAKLRIHALADPIQALFGPGTLAGFSDGQLLERFLSPGDEASDLAFETLVIRHGPMVMRVCRSILDDHDDAHDAFQAAFLVLARRSDTIRERRSVGSWLYGVAVRVAMRCRTKVVRGRIRDRRTITAAQAAAAVRRCQEGLTVVECDETAHAVHSEVSRLPEKFRAPIVLCYLEGLTHDEAAARLKWPVGTVRSRLARARDTLRARLGRRGITANSSLGIVNAWLAGERLPIVGPEPITRELSSAIVRAAVHLTSGPPSSAGPISARSFSLAQGVLNTMLLNKVVLATCAALPLAIASLGGGLFLAQKLHAQDPKPRATPSTDAKPSARPQEKSEPSEIDRLREKVLEAARMRLDAQRAFYEEGRITIDRFLDASKQFQLAELTAAKTHPERLAAMQRYVNRLVEIEKREKAELEVGRGTIADVAEASYRRAEAQLDLELARTETGGTAAILRRLGDLERKVDQLGSTLKQKVSTQTE